MILSAATKRFAEEVLVESDVGGGYVILCAVSYFLTNSELNDLLTAYASDPNQVLPALISDKVLNSKAEKDISGSLINQPRADNNVWFRLALDSDQTICHVNDLTQNDIVVCQQNAITELNGVASAARMIVNRLSNDRVIRSWTILKSGQVSPVDILAPCARSCQHIQVYDRYMTASALHALKSVLDDVRNAIGGTLDKRLTIYREIPNNAAQNRNHKTNNDIRTDLEQFFVASNRIQIWEIEGPTRGADYLHDRFVQFDDNYTFILPAGLQTFYTHRGRLSNKPSVIFQMHVGWSHSNFEFDALDESGSNRSRITLRV